MQSPALGSCPVSRTDTIELDIRTKGPPAPLGPGRFAFPRVHHRSKEGPFAFGGDFEPETIIAAYRSGAFPWPHPEEERLWFSPHPRAVIPVRSLHVSRRLARTLAQGRFRFTVDAGFEAVIRACADRPEGTWITPRLIDGYLALHELGYAHSVEAWAADGTLAGGLYGVRLGRMFGAESMFHRANDASKLAMVAMMEWVRREGIELLDIQVLTPHTESMGAVEVSRVEYLRRLADALRE